MRERKSADSQGPHKEVSEDFNISNTHLGEGANPIEHVMNVKNRPPCHHPHLNARAEMDTATHLTICMNSDCDKVDRILVGKFVTASQAQWKWYTKIITKVSSGDCELGVVSYFGFVFGLKFDWL